MPKRRNMHLLASHIIFQNAYQLRNHLTEAEQILWEYLKDRKMEGVRFRRQHPVFKFVADFYAHQLKLVIELDGEHHAQDAQKFYDLDRTEIFSDYQITVIRFSNYEVYYHLDLVLECIRSKVIEMKKSKGLG